MPRSLLIAVRFLEGRYHGREDRFDGADGWPPSPGRLFQALVAGAARGAKLQHDDVLALKWLERLDPPRVAAPSARRGRAVRLFVPNNDLDAVGGDPARVSKIRVPKSWRPCYFDADEPVLYLWDFESGSTEATRICDLATRLCQLGKGIDMAWANGQVVDRNEAEGLLASHQGSVRPPAGAGETVVPHPGTLDSLVERHRRKRERLRTVSAGPRQVPPIVHAAAEGVLPTCGIRHGRRGNSTSSCADRKAASLPVPLPPPPPCSPVCGTPRRIASGIPFPRRPRCSRGWSSVVAPEPGT